MPIPVFRNQRITLLTLLLLWGICSTSLPAQVTQEVEDTVALTWVVTLSESAALPSPSQSICIAADSIPDTRPWQPDNLHLTRLDDGNWTTTIKVRKKATIEYKFTRGTWATVEKNASGIEISNRQVVIQSKDVTVKDTIANWADQVDLSESPPLEPAALPKSTRTGLIKTHAKVSSEFLNRDRDVLVYLPPDYDADALHRFPVLYMHDGQNVFDASTSFLGVEWNADEHAEQLITSGKIEPIIIVAVYNSSARIDEYTPTVSSGYGNQGGAGGQYLKFLVKELKPLIDSTYRTKPETEHTGIAGSSLGGLISLYALQQYPEVFSKCAALSPSLWWDNLRLLHEYQDGPIDWLHGTRIWIDMGTKEGRVKTGNEEGKSVPVMNVTSLANSLASHGRVPERDFHLEVVDGAGHNEAAWAARFDKVLLFLYGIEPKN